MAVDFKDLETLLVSAPVRLRRRSARAKAPAFAPSRVVDLTVEPAVVLPVAAPVVAAAPLVVSAAVVPAAVVRAPAPAGDASYWVRRRRAEAQAADQT